MRAWLPLVIVLAACGEAPSLPGPGFGMRMTIQHAQLRRGGLADDVGGPEVTQVQRPQPAVRRGDATVALKGRLGSGAVAVHLHAKGDANHWVVAPAGFDFVVSDELQWSTKLEISHGVQEDVLEVSIQAVDAEGRFGPVTQTSFDIQPEIPPAELVVSLGWDAPVDLDLHVETPDGTVIGAKNINAAGLMSGTSAAEARMEGAWLDLDSNQQCRLDLRNRENVVWLGDPPPDGTYRVYAHLFSACGQSSVNLVAAVQQGDTIVERVGATLYDFDARIHPGPGKPPGLLVLEFEIPWSSQ